MFFYNSIPLGTGINEPILNIYKYVCVYIYIYIYKYTLDWEVADLIKKVNIIRLDGA